MQKGVPRNIQDDPLLYANSFRSRRYCSFPAFLSSLKVMLSSQIISVSFQSGSNL